MYHISKCSFVRISAQICELLKFKKIEVEIDLFSAQGIDCAQTYNIQKFVLLTEFVVGWDIF